MDRPCETVLVIHERGRRRAGHSTLIRYPLRTSWQNSKPLLLIADSSRNVPFDLAGMRVLIYDISNPGEFVSRLSELMAAALKSPTDFSLPKSKERRDKKNSLFVSYSHADREYLDRLMVHLRPLEKEGLIDLWVDTRLRAGDRWRKEIESASARNRCDSVSQCRFSRVRLHHR